MTAPVNVHPVRVRTTDGWQELALTGPKGDKGDRGEKGLGIIPGEVKLWGGKVLPDIVKYGKWVWADGTAYDTVTYPEASANIAPEWKTAHGQADPGAGKFRVPDLRGLTPCALDQMPGGARANRMTRAVAITVAAKTGEETHIITLAESANHGHTILNAAPANHYHYSGGNTSTVGATWVNYGGGGGYPLFNSVDGHYHTWGANTGGEAGGTAASIVAAGGGGAHENVQPSVFVPYIVALDS